MGSLHSARGTSLKTTIERITPVLRGWRNYYRLDTRKQCKVPMTVMNIF
ncbi:group II intron maturase-specific domain-containing protein [Turicimonas muris]